MSDAARKLLEDVLALPEDERLELASEMIASVHAPRDAGWEAAWLGEFDRRVDAAKIRGESGADWTDDGLHGSGEPRAPLAQWFRHVANAMPGASRATWISTRSNRTHVNCTGCQRIDENRVRIVTRASRRALASFASA